MQTPKSQCKRNLRPFPSYRGLQLHLHTWILDPTAGYLLPLKTQGTSILQISETFSSDSLTYGVGSRRRTD